MKSLLLCGGQSTRMGTDKGLIVQQGKPWAQLIADQLRVCGLNVIVSVNAAQYDVYQKLFASEVLVIDNTALLVEGPLKGILSAHLAYPTHDLLVLACDMPAMKAEPLHALLKEHHSGDNEVYVFSDETGVQPLCAIYTSLALERVYNRYVQNELTRFNMRYIIQLCKTRHLTIPQKWKGYFANNNSPADLT